MKVLLFNYTFNLIEYESISSSNPALGTLFFGFARGFC